MVESTPDILDLQVPPDSPPGKNKKPVPHDPNQDIALIRAAIDGSLQRVKQAIRSGGAIDATGPDFNGPALNATAKNGHEDIVKFLLSVDKSGRRKKADIQKKNLVEL